MGESIEWKKVGVLVVGMELERCMHKTITDSKVNHGT